MATSGTYYLNGPTLQTATVVYSDAALTTPAPDGWYSDGTIAREQTGFPNSVLGIVQSCPSCAVACSGTINAPSGAVGVYRIDFNTSTDVGCIIVHFETGTNPDGGRVTYDGTTFNEFTTVNDGYKASAASTSNYTFMGTTADATVCGLQAALNSGGYSAQRQYRWNGSAWVDYGTSGTNTSVTTNKLVDDSADFVTDGIQIGDVVRNTTTTTQTTVTVVSGQELTLASDIFTATPETYEIDSGVITGSGGAGALPSGDIQTSATDPGWATVYAPKLSASPSDVLAEFVGPCASTGWNVEIVCPVLLTGVPTSDAGVTCGSTFPNTFYNVKNRGGTAGEPAIHEFFVRDEYGTQRVAAGTYTINPSSGKKTIVVDANGVITSITACP